MLSGTVAFDDLGRMALRTIGTTSYTYSYSDTQHVDAPTGYRGNDYDYNAAGSQTTRTLSSNTQVLTYDAENRVVALEETRTDQSSTFTTYVYDANGKRVIKSVQNHVPETPDAPPTETLYVGNLYEEELHGSEPNPRYICYYLLGSKLVGMRRAHEISDRNGQFRIVGDHLGSTTLVVDAASPPEVKYRV
jgi:YD repeat-containing protein